MGLDSWTDELERIDTKRNWTLYGAVYSLAPPLRGEGIGGLPAAALHLRTPMQSIGYGEGLSPRVQLVERAPRPPDFAALRRATSPRKRGEVKTKE